VARANRLLVLGTMAAVLPLGVLLLFRHLAAPRLYEGDRKEARACRECGGSGRPEPGDDPALGGRCRACGGAGRVDVIIPGPSHPVTIRGVAADAAHVEPWDGGDSFRPEVRTDGGLRIERPAGVLAGVQVEFAGSRGARRTLTTGSNGQFAVELAPGRWRVTAAARGLRPASGEIQVPRLTEPIWLERAAILREPESPEEARSLYGMALLVVLSPTAPGQLRLSPSRPAFEQVGPLD